MKKAKNTVRIMQPKQNIAFKKPIAPIQRVESEARRLKTNKSNVSLYLNGMDSAKNLSLSGQKSFDLRFAARKSLKQSNEALRNKSSCLKSYGTLTNLGKEPKNFTQRNLSRGKARKDQDISGVEIEIAEKKVRFFETKIAAANPETRNIELIFNFVNSDSSS